VNNPTIEIQAARVLEEGTRLSLRNVSIGRHARCACMVSLALLASLSAKAADVYVSLDGADSSAGTLDMPFRTIGRAVAGLKPGDTLFIRSGTYFESVRIEVSGTADAPITIRSYPGEVATIDSGTPDFRRIGNADWELVDADLGEYRSVRPSPWGNIPYAYVDGIAGYENERVFLIPYEKPAHFRSTNEDYVDTTTPLYVGPGVYYDHLDHRIHIRLAKTADVKAAENRYGRVFDADLPDPRRYSIILSMALSSLEISGSYLVFQDLTVNQADRSIEIRHGAHDLRFDGVTVWKGAKGIAADGAHDAAITRSKIYGDNPYWIFWSDMKKAPRPADLARSTSIELSGGAHDWEISYNHVRGSGQDLFSTSTDESRIALHHNRFENCADDAFEIEGTVNVGRISIYENYIANCLIAVAPGQATPRFDGPLFFYRNVVSFLRNPPVNRKEGINRWNGGGRFGFQRMFKNSPGQNYSTRNAHFYNNTLLLLNSPGHGISIIPKDPQDTRVANNIMMVVNGPVMGRYRLGPGQVMDGNLYWRIGGARPKHLLWKYDTVSQLHETIGVEARGIGDRPKTGTDPRLVNLTFDVVNRDASVWELTPTSEIRRMTDFMLSADSPAIGAGIAIPPLPSLEALPDTRSSRDLGAIPFGTPTAEFDVFPFVPSRAQVSARMVSPGRISQ
jgi:Right handed beta helix region/Protein of unknown function (DUF1565)